MTRALLAAAACNLLWGGLAVFAPEALFRWLDVAPPSELVLWQGIGMLIGGYGIAYALAARDPARHWPIVFVGLLGKVAGPLSFLTLAGRDELGPVVSLAIVTNDLIWWLPFTHILLHARRAHLAATTPPYVPLDSALAIYFDEHGRSLRDASAERPLFLVFLRHFGCTFCREALADLRAARERIEAAGARLVLVHMSDDEKGHALLARHGLGDVSSLGDPERVLYRAFGLSAGGPRQLLGWGVLKRAWRAAVLEGHGVGVVEGDCFQMPGAFVVADGEVLRSYVHRTAADRPDYVALIEGLQPADEARAGRSGRAAEQPGRPLTSG